MTDSQTAGLAGLIATLDEYLVKKAPFQIPDGGKEMLVKFGPWIAIVLLVLTLPLLLFALGLGTLLVPFAGMSYATGFGLSSLLALVQVALLVLALPGLFARKMTGWMYLFYSQLASVVGSLLLGSIVGAVVGGLIGLYILFQVREKYR